MPRKKIQLNRIKMENDINTEVATVRENVRHNEKAIDKLDRDLKEFRQEIKTDIAAVKKNTDNLLWKLIATLVGSVILDVLVNKFV